MVESLTEENILLKSEQEDLIKEQNEFKVERDGLLKEQEQLRKDLEKNSARLRTENSEKSILETEDFELTEKLILKVTLFKFLFMHFVIPVSIQILSSFIFLDLRMRFHPVIR